MKCTRLLLGLPIYNINSHYSHLRIKLLNVLQCHGFTDNLHIICFVIDHILRKIWCLKSFSFTIESQFSLQACIMWNQISSLPQTNGLQPAREIDHYSLKYNIFFILKTTFELIQLIRCILHIITIISM